MKRKLLVNVVAYGGTWLVMAGLILLAHRFLGVGLDGMDWWIITIIAIGGALGDWLSVWFKSRQNP